MSRVAKRLYCPVPVLLRCLAAGDEMAMRRRSDINMGLTGIFEMKERSKSTRMGDKSYVTINIRDKIFQ